MRIRSVAMQRKPRSKPIFVRATEREHKDFNDLAIKRHTTLSELIRQLLHRELSNDNGVAA